MQDQRLSSARRFREGSRPPGRGTFHRGRHHKYSYGPTLERPRFIPTNFSPTNFREFFRTFFRSYIGVLFWGHGAFAASVITILLVLAYGGRR